MSFSLWPSSSGAAAGNSISSVTSRKTQPSSPALDFMQVLHAGGLEVSYHRDLVNDFSFDTSTPVGSGGQAVVELSRRPGVVIKRTRRFEYGDGSHVPHADENLARVMLDSIASLHPLGAGQFHLLLEYSELGDMASFLRRNGQQLDADVKIDLAYQVSSGLLFLHQYKICHGDLKVQNILVFNGKNGRY